MVPWPGGRVAVGATREDGTGFDPRATAAGVREVLDQALAVAPGLAEATIREIRVGLRPRTPDLLPLLGALPGYRNVWLATGHGPTGLTLGPFSGKLIASLARGEALDLDLGAFRPDRPGLA
jgi:D-amino-acid dehydrogenase